jgi:hypothetical protein
VVNCTARELTSFYVTLDSFFIFVSAIELTPWLLLYMYSLTAPAPATAAQGMWYDLCDFFILLQSRSFNLIVLTPFCQVDKRSLRKDLSWLLSQLPSAYSSGILESCDCSESLLGKKMV